MEPQSQQNAQQLRVHDKERGIIRFESLAKKTVERRRFDEMNVENLEHGTSQNGTWSTKQQRPRNGEM